MKTVMSKKKSSKEPSLKAQIVKIGLGVAKLQKDFSNALTTLATTEALNSLRQDLSAEIRNTADGLERRVVTRINDTEERLTKKINQLDNVVSKVVMKDHAPKLEDLEERVDKLEKAVS